MAPDFASDMQVKKASAPKPVFRLYRRLFLLTFAVAVLWQGLLLTDAQLGKYYRALQDSFKVILTIDAKINNDQLAQMGETLNQKADITSVKLFSSQDGLEVVRRQNPQLAESLLLMGRNKMPAYFELRLIPTAVHNVESLLANLTAEYKGVTPHYNTEHARLVFVVGLCHKLLRLTLYFAGLLFLAFMFMVEAYPSNEKKTHRKSAVFSGVLAGLCAELWIVCLIYPTGFLSEVVRNFIMPERQILLLVFCGLLGWTLSKWQKF